MLPLTASFVEAEHGAYLRRLRTVVSRPSVSRLRNIAVTGGYGSGKSSILEQLTLELKGRAINLSFSTLGMPQSRSNDDPSDAQNLAAGETAPITNMVQKAIVKQLLYRERPSSVPSSRYRRIGRFPYVRESSVAFFVALLVVGIGYLFGIGDRVNSLAGENLFARFIAFVICVLALAFAFVLVRRLFGERLLIERVGAGAASVALSSRSDSYFDEYLDEIVYFFEVTKCDVVIFEDIDRFDDPHIFETLRELNTILNTAKQLDGRLIQFIYAVRDSVFEPVGQSVDGASVDAAQRGLVRADRTKFFDLVIPIVPFITHRSARDLMSGVLNGIEPVISPQLVTIVAKHVADMRLIKNIHNEYVIFNEKLLTTRDALPGLTSDALFAMIVYKNVHLSDFEQVRLGQSRLDDVYRLSRSIIEEQIRIIDDEVSAAITRLSRLDSIARRSRELGDRLEAYLNNLLPVLNRQATQRSYSIEGRDYEPRELRGEDFWASLLKQDSPFVVLTWVPGYAQTRLEFGVNEVAVAIGRALKLEDWERADREALNERIAKLGRDRVQLRHSDMADLFAYSDYQLVVDGELVNFEQLAKASLSSALAVDLVESGYIDRNFTLYVSQFYDVHLSSSAMNYFLHQMQPNTMDIYFELSYADVDALLRETNSAYSSDRSMYNVDLVDRLFETHPVESRTVADRLSTLGEDERSFLGAYAKVGAFGPELFERMAQRQARIFEYVVDLDVEREVRALLFNASLVGSSGSLKYASSPSVKEYVEGHFEEFEILATASDEASAVRVAGLLKTFGVHFSSIAGLSQPLQTSVLHRHMYLPTRDNLIVGLGGDENLALDHVLKVNEHVYDFVIENLVEYLLITVDDGFTIEEAADFIRIAQDMVAMNPEAAREVIGRAHPHIQVPDIQGVADDTWPALARWSRFPATFGNVKAYFDAYGIDEDLSYVLSVPGEIRDHEEISEDIRAELAIDLLNSGEVLADPNLRISLVRSLALESGLDASRIPESSGELLGLLVEANLVDDDVSTYTSVLKGDWATREFFISKSSKFASFVEPGLMPTADLQRLMFSNLVSDEVKRAILARLAEFAVGASAEELLPAVNFAEATEAELSLGALMALAHSGVSGSHVVTLLAPVLPNLQLEEINALLGAMGLPYLRLTETGHEQVAVRANAAHQALLDRLIHEGQVSSYKSDHNPELLKVYMKRT